MAWAGVISYYAYHYCIGTKKLVVNTIFEYREIDVSNVLIGLVSMTIIQIFICIFFYIKFRKAAG